MLSSIAPISAKNAVTVDPALDYYEGRNRDRDFYSFDRGFGHRVGLPGEYRGALLAHGLDLPKRWWPLPRCLVVHRLNGRIIGRALIPFDAQADIDPSELIEAYSDGFALWRAKQAAKSDPNILIDALPVTGA